MVLRVLDDQDRVHRHTRLLVNNKQVLDRPLAHRPIDQVRLMQALGGG
jgi:hypothetical protein